MLVEKNREVLERIKENEENKRLKNLSHVPQLSGSILDADVGNYQSEAHILENEEHSMGVLSSRK